MVPREYFLASVVCLLDSWIPVSRIVVVLSYYLFMLVYKNNFELNFTSLKKWLSKVFEVDITLVAIFDFKNFHLYIHNIRSVHFMWYNLLYLISVKLLKKLITKFINNARLHILKLVTNIQGLPYHCVKSK